MSQFQPDPDDPWTLADGPGYALDKFYTRSTDSKGHIGGNIQTPLSPSLLSLAQQIVRSGNFPAYKSVQDFVRDSVIHRTKFLTDAQKKGRYPDILAANPGMQASINREMALAKIDIAKREAEQVEALLREIDEHGRRLIRAGRLYEAREAIDEWAELEHEWDAHDADRLSKVIQALREELRWARLASDPQ